MKTFTIKLSVSLSNSKIPNCVDLVFEGWPNTTGPAVYAVDAVGVIHEMRRNFKKGNAVYRVEEFLEFDGVKIPKKVVSQHTNIESKFEVESRSSWEEVALADVGYDPKQLYATYYGLPEPDLQVLPKTPWRVPRLLLLGSALIVGFLIYYALRIQKKNA